MKKLWMQCVMLCVALSLLCGAALAAGGQVGDITAEKGTTVQKVAVGDDTKFTITQTGAEKDRLYLVMIQKGTSDKPTKSDIYYINIVTAEGTTLNTEAYPMDMDAGDYTIYLSDYANNNNGARKKVASFSVTGGTAPTPIPTGTDPANAERGDVSGDKKINVTDALYVLQISAGLKNGNADWTEAQRAAADVNRDTRVNVTDALLILQKSAGLLDDNWELINK